MHRPFPVFRSPRVRGRATGLGAAVGLMLGVAASHPCHAQTWAGVKVSQNLPRDWSWSAEGQSRTAMGRWEETVLDLAAERSFDAVDGLALGGQWRTAAGRPLGAATAWSWRWATSLSYGIEVGDHTLNLRARHQVGGEWWRPWDAAKWRLKATWKHDLPDGWKVLPSVEGFWGTATHGVVTGPSHEFAAVRAQVAVDKKWAKRRHLVAGYQVQGDPRCATPVEHRLVVSVEVDLKKVKKRKASPPNPAP